MPFKNGETSLYRRWKLMRHRCRNPNYNRYADYGGRGIRVCAEWESFKVFAAWAGANGYDEALQLDRIDNGGNYSPDNCRWVDAKTNMNNTRRSRKFMFFGEELSASEASARFGVSSKTLYSRIVEHGIPPEDAANPGFKRRDTLWVCVDGQRMTARRAAELAGLPFSTLRDRLVKGWTDEDAIKTPPRSLGRAA